MAQAAMTPRAITDVPGVLVGHAHDTTALTGCTAVLTPAGAVGGVDVRGGGPGTRETDLLNPTASVDEVHGIALCGGSAFGLAGATGVVEWLHTQGYGYSVGFTRVPIVPAAVIFDLALGQMDRWADAEMGYAASAAAGPTVAEGCVGVGIGASVGKAQGMGTATKSGLGTWSETLADGTIVGALVVCNAFGDVYDAHNRLLAGIRDPERGGFADTLRLLRTGAMQDAFKMPRTDPPGAGGNTTLAVVATNARLSKAEATRLAMMAHDALPRTIRPVHTPFDGDTVFALATGSHPAPHMAVLGSIAADVLAQAIWRSVMQAHGLGGLPAIDELPPGPA